MSVARVTEISSQSGRSFEDAVRQGIRRANQTLRNISGAWVKEHQIQVTDGRITGYRVNMLVTFVLDDGAPASRSWRQGASGFEISCFAENDVPVRQLTRHRRVPTLIA